MNGYVFSIDTCPVESVSGYGDLSAVFGMLWRFIPMLDQSVTRMVVRDLDAQLTGREAAAVADWLEQTDQPFHIMRDNPYHTTEILGGMWGARMDTGHRTVFHDSMARLLADVGLV